MLISCVASVILVFGCSLANNSLSFGVLWVALNFAFSSTWGAVGSSIRKNFDPSEWGTQLSLIAAGSRLGSMLSALFYGKVLQYSKDWRLVFKAAAALQAISVVVALLLRRKFSNTIEVIKNNRSNENDESMSEVIIRVSKLPQFWLMLLGKVVLMVIGQFISFIPLYLMTGPLGMQQHKAASFSSVFSFGSLLASLAGVRLYKNLKFKQQINLVLGVNIISSIVGVFLTTQTLISSFKAPLSFSLLSLFVFGFTWALAFYTPPGIVALELGGKKHAALVTNIFDATGYLLAAIFSYYAAKFGQIGNWTGLMSSLTLCSVIASFSMYLAMKITLHKD